MNKMKNEPVRVGTTIIVVRDGKYLIGERGESCETIPKIYAFPGGRMDYGETPEDGILRERYEETGLIGKKEDLQFFRYCNEYYPESGKHYVSLVFTISKFEGDPVSVEPDKCKKWEWFDPNNLPENIYPGTRESIEMFRDKI